jgi:alpha-galactosidase/6-phospho-beta-glucosidase family protein
MKIALIGQDVPTLLPALLTDLLFAGNEANAEVTVEESNPAMQELLQGYGEKIFEKAGKGGTILVSADRAEVLTNADCVIYAGDCQAASRFFQDRSALGSDEEDNPGLTDQARVNGGIEGLLHALRAGEVILKLCDDMDQYCPKTLVINLGQPVARTTAIFLNRGYRCLGLGRTPMKGANGAETYAKRLRIEPENLKASTAGLPGFAFLTEIRDGKADLLPKLKKAAEKNELGSLSRRWLEWWDAIPAGDVTDHAEFLPAQPDYIPEEKPEFGESVEKRKERILYMNTVREQGAEAREGAMAQLLLLSKAPPIRPMRLALAVLRKETAEIPAVARRNGKEMPQLPEDAVVETPLRLVNGEEIPHGIRVPEALAEVLTEVDEANRLAAKAAMGDPGALREYVETDPALGGLDRLYCLDVVKALVRLHEDVLAHSEEV